MTYQSIWLIAISITLTSCKERFQPLSISLIGDYHTTQEQRGGTIIDPPSKIVKMEFDETYVRIYSTNGSQSFRYTTNIDDYNLPHWIALKPSYGGIDTFQIERITHAELRVRYSSDRWKMDKVGDPRLD